MSGGRVGLSLRKQATDALPTWTITALTAVLPSLAHANAGIPMLVVLWPIQGLSLFLVIVIEAWIIGRVAGKSLRPVLKSVALANVASTLVGVPAAWMLMFAIQLGTGVALLKVGGDLPNGPLAYIVNAAWVGDNATEVRVAIVVLCVVFCAASVWVERWWLRRPPHAIDPRLITRAVLLANFASYLLLCAGTLAAVALR